MNPDDYVRMPKRFRTMEDKARDHCEAQRQKYAGKPRKGRSKTERARKRSVARSNRLRGAYPLTA